MIPSDPADLSPPAGFVPARRSGNGLFSRIASSRKLLGAALAALALLAYGHTVFHGLAFDDLKTIESNPLLESDRFWRLLFSSDYFWMSGESTFRPLVTVSYFLERNLYGDWFGGYHLTNVSIHALNVLLVFFIVSRWSAKPVWGAAAAVVMALHPAGTEAVNGISFREDLLVATFILLGWIALQRGAGGGRVRPFWLFAAAIMYFAACLTKESGLVFAGLAVAGARAGLISDPPGNRLTVRRTLIALNWLMPAAILFLFVWGFWMTDPSEGPSGPFGGSRLAAACNVPFIYAHHFHRLIVPMGYQADYLIEARADLSSVPVAGGIALFILGGLIVLYLFERAPRIGFGVVWIVICLAPVSNLAPLFNPVADRYLYLPLIGFAMAGAGFLQAAWAATGALGAANRSSARKAMAVFCLAAACGMLFITNQRNLEWSSDEALWQATFEREPDSWRACYRLGAYYVDVSQAPGGEETQGHSLARATQLLKKANALRPDHSDILNSLGNAYLLQGQMGPAIKNYKAALAISPYHPSANINMARAYAAMGQSEVVMAAYYWRKSQRLGVPGDEKLSAWIEFNRRRFRRDIRLTANQLGGIPATDDQTTDTLRIELEEED